MSIWEFQKLSSVELSKCYINRKALNKEVKCKCDAIYRGFPSLLTWLHLLPLLPLDPAVLVLDPRLRQDHPGELGPRPHVEVRQLDLGGHCCQSNQIRDGTELGDCELSIMDASGCVDRRSSSE